MKKILSCVNFALAVLLQLSLGPFILRPRFLLFVEIWFEKSGSRKVVREKWLTRKKVVL